MILNQDSWTVIFRKNTAWKLQLRPEEDALRVDVKPRPLPSRKGAELSLKI